METYENGENLSEVVIVKDAVENGSNLNQKSFIRRSIIKILPIKLYMIKKSI